MGTTFTYTATGSIASAENDKFRWFFLQAGYVIDKVAGRSIYLPVGGYTKTSGWGSDPAPEDVVADARAFALAVDAENDRIAQDAKAAAADDYDDWLSRDMDSADSNN